MTNMVELAALNAPDVILFASALAGSEFFQITRDGLRCPGQNGYLVVAFHQQIAGFHPIVDIGLCHDFPAAVEFVETYFDVFYLLQVIVSFSPAVQS